MPPEYSTSAGLARRGELLLGLAGAISTSTWKIRRANSSQIEYISASNIVKPSFL